MGLGQAEIFRAKNRMADLEPLYVDREDRDKERVHEEPMRDQYDDCEGTKLANRTM